MAKSQNITQVSKPANTPDITPVENQISELDQLKALLAKFGKADIAKLVKEVSAEKHTVLSVTMDAIVLAGDNLVSANINTKATELGRECGVFTESESASPVSTAQLIRHVQAYREAVKRSEKRIVTATTEFDELPFDASKLNQGEPAYQEQPVH